MGDVAPLWPGLLWNVEARVGVEHPLLNYTA